MRSHSVSAEGGTAAVIFEEEGDSLESHIYDTIKGSDFLADQDVVERLVLNIPFEIYQLDHWGCPGLEDRVEELINDGLEDTLIQGLRMLKTRLDSLKCKHNSYR